MQYEQRISAIRPHVADFLARYSPPRAMTQQAQDATFRGICEAINRRLPASVNADAMPERLERIFATVADRHETNAWPVQSEFVKAAGSAETRAQGGMVDTDAFVSMARDWFQKFKKPGPAKDTPEITSALIAEGMMANEREAQWRGFALSDDMRTKAKQQPMGREEREHHFAVLGRLRGVSAADAEAMDKQQTEGFA